MLVDTHIYTHTNSGKDNTRVMPDAINRVHPCNVRPIIRGIYCVILHFTAY